MIIFFPCGVACQGKCQLGSATRHEDDRFIERMNCDGLPWQMNWEIWSFIQETYDTKLILSSPQPGMLRQI